MVSNLVFQNSKVESHVSASNTICNHQNRTRTQTLDTMLCCAFKYPTTNKNPQQFLLLDIKKLIHLNNVHARVLLLNQVSVKKKQKICLPNTSLTKAVDYLTYFNPLKDFTFKMQALHGTHVTIKKHATEKLHANFFTYDTTSRLLGARL